MINTTRDYCKPLLVENNFPITDIEQITCGSTIEGVECPVNDIYKFCNSKGEESNMAKNTNKNTQGESVNNEKGKRGRKKKNNKQQSLNFDNSNYSKTPMADYLDYKAEMEAQKAMNKQKLNQNPVVIAEPQSNVPGTCEQHVPMLLEQEVNTVVDGEYVEILPAVEQSSQNIEVAVALRPEDTSTLKEDTPVTIENGAITLPAVEMLDLLNNLTDVPTGESTPPEQEVILPDNVIPLDVVQVNNKPESDPEPVLTVSLDDGFNMSDVPIVMIPTDLLVASKLNFFYPLPEDKLNELVNSIRELGMLDPIIARTIPNNEHQLEILAGHNRVKVANHLKLEKVPVRIVAVDDDRASEIIIDTNIAKRELTTMEKAKAIEEKKRIFGNRQGKRTDLGNVTDINKGKKTRDIIGEQMNLSGMQVDRLGKLNDLIPELQEKVDKQEVTITDAVKLAGMDELSQKRYYEITEGDDKAYKTPQVEKVVSAFKEKNKDNTKKPKKDTAAKPLETNDIVKLVGKEKTQNPMNTPTVQIQNNKPMKINVTFPANELDKKTRELIELIQKDNTLLYDILRKYANEQLTEDVL